MVWQKVKKPVLVLGLLVLVGAGSLAIQSIGSNKALLPGVVLSKTNDKSAASADKKITPLSFDLFTSWTYVEDQTPIPDSILKYDGKYVEITGYLLPYGGTEEEHDYMLVQNMWGCCFGQAPQINHIVIIKLHGKEIEDFSGPVAVRGIFKAGEMYDDGFLVSLYQIQADVVLSK